MKIQEKICEKCGKGERPKDRSPFPYASSALVGVLIAVLVLVGVLLLVLVLLLHVPASFPVFCYGE